MRNASGDSVDVSRYPIGYPNYSKTGGWIELLDTIYGFGMERGSSTSLIHSGKAE